LNFESLNFLNLGFDYAQPAGLFFENFGYREIEANHQIIKSSNHQIIKFSNHQIFEP